MSAVCPSCGVAVVPGYRRCPKCHAALPYGSGRRSTTVDPGGTALPQRSPLPILPIVGGVAALALIVVLAIALGGGDKNSEPASEPTASESTQGGPAPAPGPVAAAPQPTPAVAPAQTLNPGGAASGLERALRRQRLWSTVEVNGTRVDVRSSACSEPAMTPTIDERADGLRGAGLTRLRCMEQSGRVVFERDL